ncbi:MAG: ATP-binding protein [Ignisphaera sp.]|uniref:ATP-binding protein n=1 Tax=Ignisphaera aggregans TaxID=334771 RepID=A0A7J3MZ54_9CREN
MLFDPKPKRRKEDLFDFDEEFNMLKKFLGHPLLVVTGLRRTGKTSLILTVLEESSIPYVFVDLRGFVRSWRDLYETLSVSISEFVSRISRFRGFYESLVKILSIVKGVSISGISIEFSWGRDRPLLTQLFTALDRVAEEHGVKVVMVFDELQRAVGGIGMALQNALAYSYDHLKNISFIISGSEMGIIYRFLKDPEAPLYGRAYLEVKTRRLRREEAVEFLVKGFNEVNYDVSIDRINEAVDKLDGIIGWLTYYGYSTVFQGKNMDDIWRDAVEMAKKELENFINYRVSRERYRMVLRLLSLGVREWGKLKKKLEESEGKSISDRVIYEILYTLRNHSIIDNENRFLDPLLEEAAKVL